METKIQLKHPQGKKAVSMSKGKYDLLSGEVVAYLSAHDDATFTDLSKGIAQNLIARKTAFEGSLNWHLEWVKLDLEARQTIRRVPKTAPQKYTLSTAQKL